MKVKFIALIAAMAVATSMFMGTALVSATPGEQNGDSLSIVQPGGGAYVIVTELTADSLDFKFGWNNVGAFTSAPKGYWIGVYDITDSHYEWVLAENKFTEAPPKLLKLQSLDETTLISGHEYSINFFVRGSYSPTVTNVAELVVYFTAP